MIHGESGVGKSWLADSAPGPRLILDAEGGAKFTPSAPKITWDPIAQAPPSADGTWDTCTVHVRDFDTLQRVFQWLNSGQHQFASVVLDSLTEIQKRCLDQISGTSQPTQQDWGSLLRQMETLVRQFRDLTMHPITPVQTVVLVLTTRIDDVGVRRPHVQGQLGLTLPYFMDVVGYLYVQPDASGELVRQLLVQPAPGYVAKDRTDKLGTVLEAPNVMRMMEVIYAQ